MVLADWAAIAITNARLYRAVRERRDELERTTRGLETTTEITRALGGETDLERVLELVVKRSRALLGARAAEIALVEGNEFVIAAAAGEGVEGLPGTRISIDDSLAGAALKSGHLQRFPEIPHDTFAYRELGARSALVTPMSFRNRPVGFLIVVDRLHGDRPFNEEDERLLEAFAASAAIAVATAQHAGDEVLRRSLEASEQERSRWARELHDETLQQLAALRVLLAGARRSGDHERLDTAVGEAIEHLKTSIGDLRSLITDLRPAALDEFGIEPALETLVSRVAQQADLDVTLEVDLACETGVPAPGRGRVDHLPGRAGVPDQRGQAREGDPGAGPRQRAGGRSRRRGARRRRGLRSPCERVRLRPARDARTVGAGARDARHRVHAGDGDDGACLRPNGRAGCAAARGRPTPIDSAAAVGQTAIADVAPKSVASGAATPRGMTITGHWTVRMRRPLTPPTRTERRGP